MAFVGLLTVYLLLQLYRIEFVVLPLSIKLVDITIYLCQSLRLLSHNHRTAIPRAAHNSKHGNYTNYTNYIYVPE